MEKLVELLNEYEIEKPARDYTWRIERQSETRLCGTEYTGAYVDDEEMERIIISKKYGFIKWLVDNDKIEFREDFYLEDQHGGGFGEDENIIMLLSIQDNPIEFLVSVIK